MSTTLPLRSIFLALLLLGTTAGVSAAQSPDLSLADVQAAYNNLEGMRAAFTQVISSEFAPDSTRLSGTVLLSGNRYRVETPTQTVVTNGETTWIYTPADSQVVVNDAQENDSAITPETFLTASTDRYMVTASERRTRNGAPHVTLDVEATTETSQFQTATLWVRQSDRVVTRMTARDRDGSTLDLRLRDIETAPSLDGAFTFTPPPDVEVIDLRGE